MSIHDQNTIPDSNSTINGINIAENCAASNLNNGLRAAIAATKQFVMDQSGSIVTSGTGDAYTATPNAAWPAYQDGLRLTFTANRANTGAITLNVGGLGPRAVKKYFGGSAEDLVSGDIVSGGTYDVVFLSSSNEFTLLNGPSHLRGSNANGEFVRYADGAQICTFRATLAFNSASRLTYDWTFPAAFVSQPIVSANLEDEFSATPSPEELGLTVGRSGASPSSTEASLRLYRISGMTDFQSGDTAIMQATAIGRWF